MPDPETTRSNPPPADEGFEPDALTVRRLPGSDVEDRTPTSSRIESAQTVVRRSGQGVPAPPSDQASPAEVAKVLEGAELGNFRLEELIGGGGMGAVFRAADTRLDRTVAVKVIPRVGDDPDLLRRFRNEAQSAAKLDHPNIARVYDVGQENGWHYIVFEYIDGINLRDLVHRDGVLSIDDAVYYSHQVADALEHASQRGVVHRDVKPSNVLVTETGQVKLVDMGLARSQHMEVTDDMTASGVTLGTFDYISPEQARDPRLADVRSDLYSLGCTLYFMLVGRPPFPGGSIVQKLMNHGNAAPPNPQAFRPEVNSELTSIIHKMLAKRPDDRYERAIDVIADLHRFAQQQGLLRSASLDAVAARPLVLWPRVVREHLPWVVSAGLLVVSTIGVYLFSRPNEQDRLMQLRELPLRAVAKLSDVGDGGASHTEDNKDTQSDGDPNVGVPVQGAPGTNNIPSISRSPESDRPPAPWTSLIVDPDVGSDDPQTVASLAAALEIARINLAIDTIEVRADRLIESRLTIPRPGLRIRAAKGFSGVVVFENESLATLESPVKIDTGGHGISMEGLHLVWDASAVRDGGAVFGVSGRAKEKIELSACSITVNNLSRRSNIVAFRVRADLETTTENALDSAAGLLVWFQWKDCVFRGQMTLIGMDAAVRMDVEWTNGLLVTSERFLESGGSEKPSFSMEQFNIKLDRVTAHCDGGFAKINLGPSGAYPVAMTRTSNRCVFVMAPDVPQFEIVGLRNLQSIAPMRLAIAGNDNAYQVDESRMGVIYRASDPEGETVEYRWTDLDDEDSWFPGFDEQRPKSTVIWSDVFPPDKPIHTHVPDDYLQDGVLPPGFNPDTIPAIPSETESISSS